MAAASFHSPPLSLLPKVETRGDVQLHKAAMSGDVQMAQRLLDSGRVHVDCADPEGTTALMLAAAHNHADVVRLLLEEGAELVAQRHSGTHALFFAAQAGHAHLVRLLIDQGAPVNLGSVEGGTPLAVAAQCGHLDVAEELVRHGAEVDGRMVDGASALFIAAQNGHAPLVRFLLSKGADAHATRHDGASALWIAAQAGWSDVVKELLRAGADPDLPRTDGATPLFKASHKGHADVVSVLLEESPCLGLLKNGESALHAAALFGHLPVVKLLTSHGAKASLRNKGKETAQDLAEQMGYDDIVSYLKMFRSTHTEV